MNSKVGRLEYRCRRCGEVDDSLSAPSVEAAIAAIIVTGSTRGLWPQSMTGQMLGVHACADGGAGVTDLIGGIEDARKEARRG